MNKRRTDRANNPRHGGGLILAILPGENPLQFELLLTKVAEEWAPDGPIEWDAVLSIAKCLFRKQRYQRFIVSRITAAQFDPSHEAYDAPMALNAFHQILLAETAEHELERALGQLGGHLADHLAKKCPRRRFATTEAWVSAMRTEIEGVLMPAVTRFGSPPDEVLIGQAAAVLTDEAFARELEFERQLDRELEQAIDRLLKIKEKKRRITFRDAQRFDRAHPTRLKAILK
jgi:hypothetical protein